MEGGGILEEVRSSVAATEQVNAKKGGGGGRGDKQARGAEEKKKKATYLPTYIFGDFLRFLGLIFKNILMVFFGSSCRETAKNAIKKIDGKRRQEKSFLFSTFSAKSF
jgi:hypothetical protein